MKKEILFVAMFLFYASIIFAQRTVWGDFKIEPITGEKKMKVTFSLVNDIFYMQPGEEEGSVELGNENYRVVYNDKDGKAYLKQILAGNEYMIQWKVNSQVNNGFPYSDDMEGLAAVMEKFAYLSHIAHHPEENFKVGPSKKDPSKIIYMELLGNGRSYRGEHNKDGEIDGFGTYVFEDKSAQTGRFENNIRQGEFTVYQEKGYRAKGNFMDGKQDGTWYVELDKGGFLEQVFENGVKKSEKDLYIAQDKNLRTALDEDHVYSAADMAELVDGEWKFQFPYQKFIFYHPPAWLTITKVNSSGDDDKYKARLYKVEEDDTKRVEYYNHTFEKEIGISNPTITIYKSRQKTPDDMEYNIEFHFPYEEGNHKYYFLRDELSMKEDQEFNDLLNNTRQEIKDLLKKLEEKE